MSVEQLGFTFKVVARIESLDENNRKTITLKLSVRGIDDKPQEETAGEATLIIKDERYDFGAQLGDFLVANFMRWDVYAPPLAKTDALQGEFTANATQAAN